MRGRRKREMGEGGGRRKEGEGRKGRRGEGRDGRREEGEGGGGRGRYEDLSEGTGIALNTAAPRNPPLGGQARRGAPLVDHLNIMVFRELQIREG